MFRHCCSVLHNQQDFSSFKRHRTRDSIIILELWLLPFEKRISVFIFTCYKGPLLLSTCPSGRHYCRSLDKPGPVVVKGIRIFLLGFVTGKVWGGKSPTVTCQGLHSICPLEDLNDVSDLVHFTNHPGMTMAMYIVTFIVCLNRKWVYCLNELSRLCFVL